MINKLSVEIHENAKNKGFYEGEKNIGELLCLIHSEVSEALEADRKNHYANLKQFQTRTGEIIASYNNGANINDVNEVFKQQFTINIKNTFEDELADIMIRVMDLAAFKNIDLEYHINMKMKYNAMREHKHGKKY